MRGTIEFWCCAALTFVVAVTCVRIEYLNVRAESYLPRTDFGGGNRKWRFAAEVAVRIDIERLVRLERMDQLRALGRSTPSLEEEQEMLERPFSDEELALITSRVETALERQRAKARLHNWVCTIGLLQYVLAPTALAWSLYFVATRRALRYRLGGVLTAVVSGVSIVMMFYRGYYASLGW